MCCDNDRAAFIRQRATAFLIALPLAFVLSLSRIQPAYSQSSLTDEQKSAVMTIIDMLLLRGCLDTDKDTLCDADELKYFGDLDEVASGDFDSDGLTNGEELNTYKSDPDSPNTDGDLLGDFAESLIGSSLTVAFTSGATLGGDTATDKAILHKLNRLSFGPTGELLNDVTAAGGIDSWIATQLVPIGLPPAPPRDTTPPAPVYNGDTYPFPYDCTIHTTPDPAQAMRDCYVSRDDDDDINVMGTIRPVHSSKQLQSRMAMFWDNHFNTDINAHGQGMMELHDDDYYFVNAFGNFNELLSYNAKKYTMLEYLDLDDNVKYNPNENFPREVMELHSVGINGGYDDTDIAQLAYILTGWDKDDAIDLGLCSNENDINTCAPNISRYAYRSEAENDPGGDVEDSARFVPLLLFEFRINDHDDGASDYDNDGTTNVNKTLTVGNPPVAIVIPSQTGVNGVLEGDQALTYLAQHQETAKFICTKLAQEFISDTPTATTVSDCATVFSANTVSANQMGLVLQNLIGSAEFNDTATQRMKLKDTQEALISLARILGWDATHSIHVANTGVRFDDSLAEAIEDAEQPLFEKAEPTGYYETSDNWQNTNIVLRRFEEINDMALEANHDVDDDEQQTQSFVSYFNNLGLTTSAEIMVHLFQIMLGGHYDEHDVKLAVDILHKVDPDNDGSTELQPFDLTNTADNLRYNLSFDSSPPANNLPDPNDRIRALIARLAALPQFHLH